MDDRDVTAPFCRMVRVSVRTKISLKPRIAVRTGLHLSLARSRERLHCRGEDRVYLDGLQTQNDSLPPPPRRLLSPRRAIPLRRPSILVPRALSRFFVSFHVRFHGFDDRVQRAVPPRQIRTVDITSTRYVFFFPISETLSTLPEKLAL